MWAEIVENEKGINERMEAIDEGTQWYKYGHKINEN